MKAALKTQFYQVINQFYQKKIDTKISIYPVFKLNLNCKVFYVTSDLFLI